MTKRVTWLVLISLVALGIVLASCAPSNPPAPPTTPVSPITSAVPTATTAPVTPKAPAPIPTATSVPKYGGKLVDVLFTAQDTFDFHLLGGTASYSIHITNEPLLEGDWAKGPAGTNLNPFWVNDYETQTWTGQLAESWDIPDRNTIIFRLRKGIHYALNSNSEASKLVGGREVVAEDIAFNIERRSKAPGYFSSAQPGWFGSVSTPDKYTVVVKGDDTKGGTTQMWLNLSYNVSVYPPEVVKKYGDMQDWRNSVGSGPFMLTDYVSGGYFTFTRNPNYWQTDPIGPGKGNQLPYLDKVVWLIIEDKSTQMAALRTAKIDHLGGTQSNIMQEDMESLQKTTPSLQWKGDLLGRVWNVYMRVDKPELPFYKQSVRRALHMAVNLKEIKDSYYSGKAEVLNFPIPSYMKDVYTPLDKETPSIQELFTYSPDKAKKLLADAGYPNGFKTIITVQPIYVDVASLVAAYWEKIGVKADIDLRDSSVFKAIQGSRAQKEMMIFEQTTGAAYRLQPVVPSHPNNVSIVNDPYLNDIDTQIWSWENWKDPTKRAQLLKDRSQYILDQAFWVTLPTPLVYNAWQPWVKNYHGENLIGHSAEPNWAKYVWIDQALKAKR